MDLANDVETTLASSIDQITNLPASRNAAKQAHVHGLCAAPVNRQIPKCVTGSVEHAGKGRPCGCDGLEQHVPEVEVCLKHEVLVPEDAGVGDRPQLLGGPDLEGGLGRAASARPIDDGSGIGCPGVPSQARWG